ncbi:unnamed protein product [Clonostachys rosea f. rosea IK726]|uniref:F-box domain-containing protein n=2 Tax=Bionectria ochroleuca TaxID=29856 RepID=A0A0B7KD21_BIOOC|nr:unnamed protein product [Clonostachys rosea f. rosea IK726]
MSQAQSQGATLSWLPNELLIPIVQESVKIRVIPDSRHSKISSFKQLDSPTAAALALTSRYFHQLVTPLLYSEIEIQCNATCQNKFKEIWITRHLHRTFRENPSLRTHCKRLGIEFGCSRKTFVGDRPSHGTNLFWIAFDFLKWLPNIEELRLVAWPQYLPLWAYQGLAALGPTRGDYLQVLSLASEHLASLRHLELATRGSATLDLPALSTTLGGLDISACLRILDIRGISSFGTMRDWELLKARAGTASFTELKLRYFDAGPSALEALVMWPAKLASFHSAMPLFSHFSFPETVVAYDLGVLQSILCHQKDSLTFIRMDQIMDGGPKSFNMTEFRNLKVLWLAHDLTGTDPEFVANLLSPNLEVFHWNLMLEDREARESLDAFEKREEDWLRAFTAAAIASNSTLRHINIRFSPEDYIKLEDTWGLEYPWDRMDRIASEIQPHGIHLSYSPIKVSRERFNALVKVPKHLKSSWQLKEFRLSDGYSPPPGGGARRSSF